MPFELYCRVCVGALLKPSATQRVLQEYYLSLGLSEAPAADDVFQALRLDVPKHKRHEPDRVRYERSLEAFLDARWDVDFAIGGVSPDGLVDPVRGYLFVGVRVEQFEMILNELPRRAEAPERPQWLRKGDLSPGSELAHSLGPDVRKAYEHACRSYSRAAKEIVKDATARLKNIPISLQHEPDFALCRWAVDVDHFSVMHRHGRHGE